MTEQFDAIVIGSGISGGWAAKELTEKGLKVLVLERGKPLEHGKDYYGEHATAAQLQFYGMPDREANAGEFPAQKNCPAFDETTRNYWIKDLENPYIQPEGKPFDWIRGDIVGGRSIMWGRQSYRFNELDFQANSTDGNGVAWPVSYQDIAPWYSYVEKFIGVSGQKEGWDQLPDGEFLPPMEFFAVEKTMKRRLNEKMPHVPMTIGRAAILTQNHNGRAACHYCGPCHRGCSTGSYFSSQSSTLPAAKATGNLTLLPNMLATILEHSPDGKRITGVNTINTQTGERKQFTAKIVFLCASTIASAQLMLNSSSELHPNGLANGSDALGRNIMDHMIKSNFAAFVDDTDSYYQGERPNGVYIARFRNLNGQDDDADFVRGYGYQGGPARAGWDLKFNQKGFGADYKNNIARAADYWFYSLASFTECLPYETNRVTLHQTKTDKFGMPQPIINFEWGDNEKRMMKDATAQAEKIFRASGAVYYELADTSTVPPGGVGIHEMGTARMGLDPKTSVLNGYNQAHEIDNLFITDGSFMTSASCVNPSLTYMAFTARACDYAVKQLKSGKFS